MHGPCCGDSSRPAGSAPGEGDRVGQGQQLMLLLSQPAQQRRALPSKAVQGRSLWDSSNTPRVIPTHPGGTEGTQDPPAIAESVSGTNLCCSWGQVPKRAGSARSPPLPTPLQGSEPLWGCFGQPPSGPWRLQCLGWFLGGPRISAAGPGATNRSEPREAQGRLNPELASQSTSSEHRPFYKRTDTLQ